MKKFIIILILLPAQNLLWSQSFTKLTGSIVSIDSGASRSVNWIDYDNDNDLDLFISNGYRYGENNLLYRNDNGVFVKIYNQPPVRDSFPSDGSSWGDFNNDGYPDLCVVNWYNKIKLLYENNGGGNFTFLQSNLISTQPSYSETCSWGDYNNDGLLDLFVTNSEGSNHRNFLYRNTGSSNFVRIDTGVISVDIGYSRGINWVDADNDRDLDIFVCRERNQNEFLYINNGNGSFAKLNGSPLTSDGGESWSASWGDYDNDGDLDVFIANNSNQKNSLFRNDGNLNFVKVINDPITEDPGYGAVTGWGDYDNDGDLDMFVSQAYVPPLYTQKLVNRLYKNKLMETGSASFEKITSDEIVNDSGYTYGFAWGDYDNDGDLDIAEANTFGENQKNALYKNDLSNGNKWLNVKCTGTITNKSAIGTKVRIKANINGNAVWQMQEIDGQSGYCAQNLVLHFGLGNAQQIDTLKVEWQSGSDQIYTDIPVNQSVTITENGNMISVNENISAIKNFELHQNYPNPFNPTTKINYEIKPAASGTNIVSLKVYDVLGNEVAALVNQKQSSTGGTGRFEVEFDGSNFPSGVYYYKLCVNDFTETKRMMLVK